MSSPSRILLAASLFKKKIYLLWHDSSQERDDNLEEKYRSMSSYDGCSVTTDARSSTFTPESNELQYLLTNSQSSRSFNLEDNGRCSQAEEVNSDPEILYATQLTPSQSVSSIHRRMKVQRQITSRPYGQSRSFDESIRCQPTTTFPNQDCVLKYRPKPNHQVQSRLPFPFRKGVKELSIGQASKHPDLPTPAIADPTVQSYLSDANSYLHPNLSNLRKLLQSHGMYDLVGSQLALTSQPATHIKGNHRIDYIFGSEAVLHAVMSAEIEPFHDDVVSDHRGQFVDIDISALLRGKIPPISPRDQRRLSSRNIQSVLKYKDVMCKGFVQFDLCKRLHKIKSSITDSGEISDDIATKLNFLDSDLTAVMQQAEKQCSNVDHNLPWSPTLHQAFLQCKYWRLMCSKYRGIRVNTVTLSALSSQITDFLPDPNDLRTAKKFQRAAAKNLHRIKHQAYRLRMNFLENKMAEAQHNHQNKLAGAIKSILHTESRRRSFRMISTYMNNSHKSQIEALLIPDPSDPHCNEPKKCVRWKTIRDPHQIEELLITRNCSHFQQAQGTPFTVPPLSTDLGFCASTEFGDQILNGTYDSSSLEPQVADLVRQLQTPSTILQEETFSINISSEELQQGYQKWREATSTSPISGRHLGHYRSLLSFNMHEDINHSVQRANSQIPVLKGHVELPIDSIGGVFYRFQADLLNIATAHGFAFERWKQIVTLLIEKDVGSPKLHRLRVLHLYEADFNLVLKLVYARRLMSHCERLSLLHPDQWGGRKDRSAADQALLKELTFTNSTLTRRNLSVFDLDATACYDRIIPNLALLSCRRFGLPASMALLLGTVLESAKYYLRTGLGLSSVSYSHSESHPVYGTGQGSGASPPIWLLISVLLMAAFNDSSSGATLSSPNGMQTVHQRMDGFVDDAAIWCSVPSPSVSDLCNQLQKEVQQWEKLLFASGGALELSKCCFYILSWGFTSKGVPFLEPNTSTVTIQDSRSNLPCNIMPYQCEQAHKTLGQWKSANLDQARTLEVIRSKCELFGEALANSPLSITEARLSYDTVLLPRLRYLLTTTFLSEKELYDASKSVLRGVLSWSGVNSNSPRAVVFCPIEYGGFGFRNLYHEQGVLMITTLLCHINGDTELGKLISVNLSWLQLHAGIQTPLFETTGIVQYLPDTWLTGVHRFLVSIEGRLSLYRESLWIPPLLRSQDSSIMPLFSSVYQKAELVRLNRVRLFLQVYNVSDIVSPDGTTIMPGVLTKWINPDGTVRLHDNTRSMYDWPKQGPPSREDFRLWSRALRKVLRISQDRLGSSLGSWCCTPLEIANSREWLSVVCSSSLIVAYRTQWVDSPEYYSIHTFRRRTCVADLTSAPAILDDCFPCPQATAHTLASITLPVATLPTLPRKLEVMNSFTTWMSHSSPSSECPNDDPHHRLVFTQQQLQLLVRCVIQHTSLLLCSDGGVKQTRGTYGWVCAVGRTCELMSGYGTVYGSPRLMQSFRAEAMGALSLFRRLDSIAHFYPKLYALPMDWHCDNISLVHLVQRAQRTQFKPRPCHGIQSDADLIIPLFALMKKFVPLQIYHVKAHQDRVKPPSALTDAEGWNVVSDKLATAAYTSVQFPVSTFLPPMTSEYKCRLDIQGLPISSFIGKEIRRAAATPAVNGYYQEKHNWSQSTVDVIDWLAQSKALLSFSHSDRVRLQKFRIRWLPVGKRCFLTGQVTKECPFCQADETSDHLLQCPHPGRQKDRKIFFQRFREFLKTVHTEPGLSRLLLQSLTHWTERSQHHEPFQYDGKILPQLWSDHLLQTQSAIGWHLLWNGYWSQTWGDIMDVYFHQQRIKSTGTDWASSVLRYVWRFVLDTWSSRNAKLHSSVTPHLLRKQTRELHHEVEILYSDCLQLYGYYPSLFSTPQHEIQAKSNYFLKYWCERARRDLNQRRVENHKRQGQDIRSFFDDPRYFYDRADALLGEVDHRFGDKIPDVLCHGVSRLNAKEKDLGYWCDFIKMKLDTTSFDEPL